MPAAQREQTVSGLPERGRRDLRRRKSRLRRRQPQLPQPHLQRPPHRPPRSPRRPNPPRHRSRPRPRSSGSGTQQPAKKQPASAAKATTAAVPAAAPADAGPPPPATAAELDPDPAALRTAGGAELPPRSAVDLRAAGRRRPHPELPRDKSGQRLAPAVPPRSIARAPRRAVANRRVGKTTPLRRRPCSSETSPRNGR